MKYIIFTFTGYSLPLAKQLIDEGNSVIVAQIQKPEQLGVKGWQSQKEEPEQKKRRLSIYNGIVDKFPADKVYNSLKKVKNKENYFVITDHNNLCVWGEALLKLGFKGFIQTTKDFDREKDREKAQEFVKKYYKKIKIPESYTFKDIQQGIDLVNESENFWVLKSNGNLAETIIPKVKDLKLNHQEIVGALNSDKQGYEKEGYLLEEKIMEPIEFTPELAFWDGKPIYSQIEIECKPIGAGDVGSDGGGAVNLVVKTNLDDPINKLCFPPIVYEMMKNTKGLQLFDAGILYNPDDDQYYFTEFAGNRWSWGGVFSEMSMSENGDKIASNYFESVSRGENPLNFKFGSTISLYNMLEDDKIAGLHKEDINVIWDKKQENRLYLYQIKKDKDQFKNVGYSDILFGYVGGNGNTIKESCATAYKAVKTVSLKEVLYRYEGDYMSKDYSSSIINRYNFLIKKGLINEVPEEEDDLEKIKKQIKEVLKNDK